MGRMLILLPVRNGVCEVWPRNRLVEGTADRIENANPSGRASHGAGAADPVVVVGAAAASAALSVCWAARPEGAVKGVGPPTGGSRAWKSGHPSGCGSDVGCAPKVTVNDTTHRRTFALPPVGGPD